MTIQEPYAERFFKKYYLRWLSLRAFTVGIMVGFPLGGLTFQLFDWIVSN